MGDSREAKVRRWWKGSWWWWADEVGRGRRMEASAAWRSISARDYVTG